MQISLGTAQIGMNYGIASKCKSINIKELNKIFLFLKKNEINSLDISPLYGNLFEKISKFRLNNFKITYKIYIPNKKNFEKEIENKILNDLKKLNISKFENILIHNPHKLNKNKLKKTFFVLEKLKKKKIIKKVGISAYNMLDFKRVYEIYKLDIMQVPINIFDQRFLENDNLRKIKKKGVELQVRSIFLQGILLMDIKRFKKIFVKKNPAIKAWSLYCNNDFDIKFKNSINFINQLKFIKTLIVGIEDLNQLKKFIKISKIKQKKIDYKKFSSKSNYLIDPRKWVRQKIIN